MNPSIKDMWEIFIWRLEGSRQWWGFRNAPGIFVSIPPNEKMPDCPNDLDYTDGPSQILDGREGDVLKYGIADKVLA